MQPCRNQVTLCLVDLSRGLCVLLAPLTCQCFNFKCGAQACLWLILDAEATTFSYTGSPGPSASPEQNARSCCRYSDARATRLFGVSMGRTVTLKGRTSGLTFCPPILCVPCSSRTSGCRRCSFAPSPACAELKRPYYSPQRGACCGSTRICLFLSSSYSCQYGCGRA